MQMRETAEFRVDEEFAPLLFSESEGRRLGDSVRKVELSTSDARFQRVGALQSELRRTHGKPFFYGWKLRRRFTKAELAAAQAFQLRFTSTFEPAGEECGTRYDEATACGHCGAGAKQRGPLFLDLTRIPHGKDFARTIAGERIVSRRVVDLFGRNEISGVSFHPVRSKGAKDLEWGEWSQLVVQSAPAEIVPPTRTGPDPFDDDPQNQFRCPAGDLLGIRLISGVSISASSRGDADIFESRQYIGVQRGMLRPEREIFISPEVWRLIESEKLKGYDVEVVQLVD